MAEETILTVESKQCVVCVEEIDGVQRLHALGPCNHLGVCSLCYLRLRQLMKEDTCVLCKTVMDKVMVCDAENIRLFDDFEVWGDSAGPDYDWDDKCRMFLPKTYNRGFVVPLQEHRCGVESCPRPKSNNLFGLEKHLREKHHRAFCKVCMKNRKVFLMEQVRYTNIELQQHIVSGDAKLGQAGHPRCEFCKVRYYDASQLHDHLVKDHYSCHVCEKQGIFHKYYRDYTDLEKHFRSGHHLCEEEECLEKKFVVFADEIDLRAHTLQMHPSRSIQRKIQVNFKVKRSNWDGTGDEHNEEAKKKEDEEVHEWTYEGEIGEQTDPPEVLAARREAARQAARNAGMTGLPAPPRARPADDFPSLSSGVGRQTTGWANLAANAKPRAEDFPALGGGGGGGGGKGAGASFRSAVEAYPTRAQEIAMSGAGDGGWCYDYPMPPSAEQAAGKGGGPKRVAGIGNMKLKVDKKAGKRKTKGGGGGGNRGGAEQHAPKQQQQKQQQKQPQKQQQKQQQQQQQPTVAVVVPPTSPRTARAIAAAVVAEEFPLAPGMRAPPPIHDVQQSPAAAAAGPSQAQTLAQSIARQHPGAGGDAGEVGAEGGGPPPSAVMELKYLLGEEAFSEVKELSGSYREGWIMPGEYFMAMKERLPAERFGELFEGLVDILPDEDKRREMLVLLAASRSVQAKASAKKNKKSGAGPKSNDTGSSTAPDVAGGIGSAASSARSAMAELATAASVPESAHDWPGVAEPEGRAKKQNGQGKGSGSGTSNGTAGGKKSATAGAKKGAIATAPPASGSAATWLKAMGAKPVGKTGGTGISVVRSTKQQPKKSSYATGGSRLQCNDPRPRSESPPPGVPLRRRGDDAGDSGGGTIGTAGASWATQGGAGFKGGAGGSAEVSRKGMSSGHSRDDFPGLPGSGAGGLGGSSSGRIEGRSTGMLPASRASSASPAPPTQQRPPSKDDFPGLPMPAPAVPGMERVEWGNSSSGGGDRAGERQSGAGWAAGSSGGGGGGASNGGGGKGAKKKNKQKAEKDALKGLAFGFR